MHQDLTVSVSEMRVILKRMYLLVRRGMQYVSLLAGGMHWVIWFAAENVEVKASVWYQRGEAIWPHHETRRGYNGPHNSVGLEEDTEPVLGSGGCIPLFGGEWILLHLVNIIRPLGLPWLPCPPGKGYRTCVPCTGRAELNWAELSLSDFCQDYSHKGLCLLYPTKRDWLTGIAYLDWDTMVYCIVWFALFLILLNYKELALA